MPAAAIPSPELIVGSLSSLSQIGAVIGAMLGGGALIAGTRQGASVKLVRRLWLAIAGLVMATGGLIALLLTVMSWQADATRQWLEANLLRPARQAGQQLADASLKELTYKEQQSHPLGISTDAAAAWIAGLADNDDRIVIDARNDAEVEMGGLAAPRIIRLSDFNAADPANANRKFVFFCHNGNRSYETCEAARARGIDCRFIIGGMEKWVVERRPMSGLQGRTLDQLRAIPDYPGNGRLLDTPEVKTLVAEKDAQFVDVRYPGEFAVHHLPGAINITLRRMSASEKSAALATIPKRPVILPCYDRRSCFFADIMGLELTRAGHTVEGRYTVPHEYILPAPRPPHVEAFIADANKSNWQKAREALAAGLVWLASTTGLPLALLLMAIASRLLVLPFALKSERDQIVADRTADAVAALKRRLDDDPTRLRRALLEHATRHNLTPVRNLAALLFLPVLALATLAAGDAATLAPHGFAWLRDLAAPDPTIALPLVFALLLTLYCVAAFARTARQRLLTTALVLPLLTATTAMLPAAASFYLTISAVLLVAQRAWITRVPHRLAASVSTFVRDLSEARLSGALRLDRATTPANIGNKAVRLAAMTRRGYPVPRALVLNHATLSRFLADDPKRQRRLAKRFARTLGGTTFAVRSSAAGEDGAAASFAGVFESELNVPRDRLPVAIRRVAASFAADRVAAYGVDGGHGNIVIQRMIKPDKAGVLFTRAPDAPGQMLVEMVDGTGDDLASGRRTPTTHRFGRLSFEAIGTPPALDLRPLLELGQRIARDAGKPQDIEWAYANGRFNIVQARDIAADLTEPAQITQAEALFAQVADVRDPDVPLFHTSAMAELMPRPSRLSLDLLNALWSPGGSVDRGARRLGLTYPAQEGDSPRYVRINGRLAADLRLETSGAVIVSSRQRKRLAREQAARITAIREELTTVTAMAHLTAAIDLTRLTDDALRVHWQATLKRFLTTTHPIAEEVNILAGLAVAGSALDTASSTRPAWHSALLAANDLPRNERLTAWTRIAGHRSNLDYELAHPRWAEVPGALEAFAGTLKSDKAQRTVEPGSLADLAALKEDAKHEVLRELAHLRAILLDVDRRLGLGGHIFELTLAEVACLHRGDIPLFTSRERRHAEDNLRLDPAPPARVTLRDLERLSTPDFAARSGLHVTTTPGEARCKGRGKRVSGRIEIIGRVFVASQEQAEAGLPLDGFRDGDILVTPLVHPDWLGVVLRSGGVVADTGSWLSHMAIVAREHGIGMIVGVPNGGQFRTGDRVRLGIDGRVTVEADTVARLSLVAAR